MWWWWCQETQPRGARHAARLSFLLGRPIRGGEVCMAGGRSMAESGLVEGLLLAACSEYVCGLEACRGTMACSGRVLRSETNADDTEAGALSQPRVERPETSERAARGDLPKKCAGPGDQVMKQSRGKSPRGRRVVSSRGLSPAWGAEAEACSAAGRGRAGAETVSERASWCRSEWRLRKPA
jgi:hypothetical protein